jgi:valyl-tRNA synthetase
VEAALAAYRFNDAASALYQFAWGEFCDWYIEFTKPILTGADETAKRETRAATAWALGQLLHLLHPSVPFLTEELWEQGGAASASGAPDMLITAPWPTYDEGLVDPEAAAELGWVIRVISEIRTVRAEMNVPPAAQISMLVRDAGSATLARLATHRDLIQRLARLDGIRTDLAETPKGAVQIVVDEATIMLPLAGIIDIGREKARLQKEIDKLAGEIEKTEKKLANEQFVAKAPPEVIEEQRERLAEAGQARAKLVSALERLSAL